MTSVRKSSGESKLAVAVLVHLGLFVIWATWALGGNVPWSRSVICWWGTLGGGLTLIGLVRNRGRKGNRAGCWLWPFALLNLVVLLSATNPSLRPIAFDDERMFLPAMAAPFRPSSAQPNLSLHALWLFDAIYLSCFNLLLVIRRRHSVRILLAVATVNAVILAVFGSFQKLTHASGIFFGAIPSPQPAFFASFIYHNHWGAYAVLMIAAGLGLTHVHVRDTRYRNFWHSPGLALLFATLVLALAIPLSTSRSCTILALILLIGALLHWLRSHRDFSPSTSSFVSPLRIIPILVFIGVIFAGFELARPTIDQRLAKTTEQVAELRARGDFGSRQELYRDTWQMARDKLIFGWGLGSYPLIFTNRYNSQQSPADGLPVFYYDAHSDWLQSLAEVGIAGTVLFGLLALVPLISVTRRGAVGTLPVFLFSGCGLILLYAWVEFPFGNPAVVITWWLCFFCGIQHARLDARDRV